MQDAQDLYISGRAGRLKRKNDVLSRAAMMLIASKERSDRGCRWMMGGRSDGSG